MFRLYREPEPQETVVISADPSEGAVDYCAAIAKSKKQGDSFMVYQGKIDSAQFGYELFKMARFIQTKTGTFPIIGVERNTGMATIVTLQNLNYANLFRMPSLGTLDPDSADKIGWTTNVATRPKMLDELALSLKQMVNKIYDKETIRELMSFIRNEKSGKAEAASGTHDDLVMAEAIAWQLYQLAATKDTNSLEVAANRFPKQELYDERNNPRF